MIMSMPGMLINKLINTVYHCFISTFYYNFDNSYIRWSFSESLLTYKFCLVG